MPINPVIHFSMAHCFFRIVSDPLGGSRWPWRKEQFTDKKDLNTTYQGNARETKGTWQERRHFWHLPSHSLKRYEVAGTISSDQLEASHNKGRRNWMNGLGEVGCVYVCSARVELLWFQSGFRVVSDPFGGSRWPWWKEQFTDRKDLNTTYKEMLGKQKEHDKNGDISHTYLRIVWKDMKWQAQYLRTSWKAQEWEISLILKKISNLQHSYEPCCDTVHVPTKLAKLKTHVIMFQFVSSEKSFLLC
jgi:hypothetical protein